jgi:pimeloyl-ACP methyl ester carboxylesterase
MHDDHGLPGDDVVVDGVRLHVVRHGRASNDGDPVLLLLHGLGTTGRLWCDVARDLEHTHRSVIPDLAGCGQSEHPGRERCDPDAQARLLLGLLDALGHERAVVVGHDLGGIVAARLVALAPARMVAAVLVSVPLHSDVWPGAALASMLTPARVPGLGASYAAALRIAPVVPALLARLTGSTVDRPAERAAYAAALTGPDGARGLAELAAAVDTDAIDAARAGLAGSAVATLVLWGEADTRTGSDYGRRLAEELGAVWVPVDDAGHLLPSDRPERVAEELAGFLAELPGPAAAAG